MIENNIFYYDGKNPLRQNWYPNGNLQYDNNLYYNFANTPSGDQNAIAVKAGTKVLENAGSGRQKQSMQLPSNMKIRVKKQYLTDTNWQKIHRRSMQENRLQI